MTAPEEEGRRLLAEWKAQHVPCTPRWEDGSTCLRSDDHKKHCDNCGEAMPCRQARLVAAVEEALVESYTEVGRARILAKLVTL